MCCRSPELCICTRNNAHTGCSSMCYWGHLEALWKERAVKCSADSSMLALFFVVVIFVISVRWKGETWLVALSGRKLTVVIWITAGNQADN